MTTRPPRVWISTDTPAQGEIVRVRAQAVHPMESGFRIDANGDPIPQNTVDRVRVQLDDELLMDWLPERAIAQNPYLEFTFAARRSGTLRMVWTDARGDFATTEHPITVQG